MIKALIVILIAISLVTVDYVIIKYIRNLTKKDKIVTTLIKAMIVLPILSINMGLKDVIISCIFINIIFDCSMGWLLKRDIFYLGNNSFLDYLGDIIDFQKDNHGFLYFCFKIINLTLIVIFL